MNKLICQKCGGEISNDFNNTLVFCTNCGANLSLAESEKTLSLPDSEALVSAALRPAKSKTNKVLLYVIGGFGLLGVLVLAAAPFFFYGLPIVMPVVNKQYTCSIPGEPEPQTSDAYLRRAGKHIELAGGDSSANVDNCAFGALNEALRLNPGNVDALILRGYAYRQRKQYELAIADYDKAVQLEPENVNTYIVRRYFYEHLEKFDKAIEDQTAVLSLQLKYNSDDTERSIEDYQKRAELYSRIGDFDNAVKDYTEIIRLKPNSAYGYPTRAKAFWDKGDFENAVKDWTEVIRLEPYEANHYYARAEAYRKLGKNNLADEDERKYRELYDQKR